MHLKNCVDDSSVPLVCTCQAYAKLFPHLGHSILTVGKVRSFCSCFPIIAMDSCGERSMDLGETGGLSPVCFL